MARRNRNRKQTRVIRERMKGTKEKFTHVRKAVLEDTPAPRQVGPGPAGWTEFPSPCMVIGEAVFALGVKNNDERVVFATTESASKGGHPNWRAARVVPFAPGQSAAIDAGAWSRLAAQTLKQDVVEIRNPNVVKRPPFWRAALSKVPYAERGMIVFRSGDALHYFTMDPDGQIVETRGATGAGRRAVFESPARGLLEEDAKAIETLQLTIETLRKCESGAVVDSAVHGQTTGHFVMYGGKSTEVLAWVARITHWVDEGKWFAREVEFVDAEACAQYLAECRAAGELARLAVIMTSRPGQISTGTWDAVRPVMEAAQARREAQESLPLGVS